MLCVQREELIKKEVDERIQWVLARENELKAEEMRLEEVKRELEESTKKVQQQNAATTTTTKGSLRSYISEILLLLIHYPAARKDKNPPEEVRNLLELTTRTGQVTSVQQQCRRKLDPRPTPQPTLPRTTLLQWKHPFRAPFNWIRCPPR
jgi:hypothetical protein